ncbi:hypothetical protein PsorP6_010016 [Peronosclerospora sorghi]|uniref:Uncharacterized protein n=1 Tax=Peronosclerospora sorghi TaxID=230839 RepID=A0ACC0VTR4_9STRA|nr:hypothetical protein PsorP6_010016 [Peronosclerospora sorghi]
MTLTVLAAFYVACEQHAKLNPWDKLAERHAIRIDAVGKEELRLDGRHHVGRGTVFSSVISAHTGNGANGDSREHFRDLESRFLPPGEQVAKCPISTTPDVCSFDDLDVIVKHSLRIATVDGESLYSSAVVFRHGTPSVPDVTELAWLTRALRAQIEIIGHQPHTVMTMHDVERLRKVVKAQRERAPVDGTSDSHPGQDETQEDKAQVDDKEDGAELPDGEKECTIM